MKMNESEKENLLIETFDLCFKHDREIKWLRCLIAFLIGGYVAILLLLIG